MWNTKEAQSIDYYEQRLRDLKTPTDCRSLFRELEGHMMWLENKNNGADVVGFMSMMQWGQENQDKVLVLYGTGTSGVSKIETLHKRLVVRS